MNTLAWNKAAAALLLGILLYKGIEIFAEGVFEVAETETKAYVVEGLEIDEPAVAEATAVEAPAPEEDILALLAVASPEQGKRVFRGCQACHDVSQDAGHKIGPNLYGVMGAPVAQHSDYRYSDALAGYDGNWDIALMNDWLISPAGAIPGNKMTYRGVSRAGDRAALIAYLNSNSDSPLALPEAPTALSVTEAVDDATPVDEETVEETIVEPAEEAAPEDTAESAGDT